MSDQPLAFSPFALDPARGTLLRDGAPVAASGKDLLLLEALVRADRALVAKTDLLDAAWPAAAVEESSRSVQIAALRKLLGPTSDGGHWIATVPRVGYRFAAAPGP